QKLRQAADREAGSRLIDRLDRVDELGSGDEAAAAPVVAQETDGARARLVIGSVLLQRPFVGRPQRLSIRRKGEALEALVVADPLPAGGQEQRRHGQSSDELAFG